MKLILQYALYMAPIFITWCLTLFIITETTTTLYPQYTPQLHHNAYFIMVYHAVKTGALLFTTLYHGTQYKHTICTTVSDFAPWCKITSRGIGYALMFTTLYHGARYNDASWCVVVLRYRRAPLCITPL